MGRLAQTLGHTKFPTQPEEAFMVTTKKSSEQTSPKVASTAAKILSNPKSTPAAKSIAGSALTQAPNIRKK